jgi:ribonuclease P protein component
VLRKEFRLKKSKEIERTAKCGRSVFLRDLGIKYAPNNLSLSRFAVVVGLKVHKKATKRNRIKRQIREIVRLSLSKIKSGFDVLILTKPSIIGKKHNEISDEIFEALQKAKLLV